MPVTAEDVVFSLDRITLPGAQRARTGFLRAFYEHQTAEVIDDKSVRVPLKYQAPTFMPNLASDYMKMYPKHIAEDLTQEQANQPENLIGSGPWLLDGWQKDVSYTFARNETYFKEGRPFFDGIIVHLIPDTARRIAALASRAGAGNLQPLHRRKPPRSHGGAGGGDRWPGAGPDPSQRRFRGVLPQQCQAAVR